MNNPFNKLQLAKHKKAILITIVVAVLGFGTWFILRDYFFLPFDNRNFAEEVAKPIEQSLTKLGAVEKCRDGYNGRGADSRGSTFSAYFELPVPRQEAIKVIKQAFADAGYSVSQATVENRGNLSIADQFVGNYYLDNSKKSTYQSLQDGNIQVGANLLDEGTRAYPCGTTATDLKSVEMTSDSNQTGIGIGVMMPDFK